MDGDCNRPHGGLPLLFQPEEPTMLTGVFLESPANDVKKKFREVDIAQSTRHIIPRWLPATGMEPAPVNERGQRVVLTPPVALQHFYNRLERTFRGVFAYC